MSSESAFIFADAEYIIALNPEQHLSARIHPSRLNPSGNGMRWNAAVVDCRSLHLDILGLPGPYMQDLYVLTTLPACATTPGAPRYPHTCYIRPRGWGVSESLNTGRAPAIPYRFPSNLGPIGLQRLGLYYWCVIIVSNRRWAPNLLVRTSAHTSKL